MTTNRALIKTWVVSRLTGQTAAGTRVYNSRVDNGGDETVLPAINVYISDEAVDYVQADSPWLGAVKATLVIELVVAAVDTYAADLENLWEAVYNRLPQQAPGNGFDRLVYESSSFDYSAEGQKPLAVAKMTYAAFYGLEEGALPDPESLPTLNSIYVDWDMASPNTDPAIPGPDGQIDAQDRIIYS